MAGLTIRDDMVEIVSCWRSVAMTFAKKIDRKIGEKTVASIEEKIVEKNVERIAETIGGSSVARIGKSIDARIAETRHDQMRAVSCEGLIGLIMSPATMDGKGGIPRVRLRWIGRTGLSESNDRRKLKSRNDRKDRKSLSDLNGPSAPSGRKNRSEWDETDELCVWKSYSDRLLRGGMLSFGILPDLLRGEGFR